MVKHRSFTTYKVYPVYLLAVLGAQNNKSCKYTSPWPCQWRRPGAQYNLPRNPGNRHLLSQVQLRQYIRASPKQKRRLTARPDEGAAGGRGKTEEQEMWLGGCKGPFLWRHFLAFWRNISHPKCGQQILFGWTCLLLSCGLARLQGGGQSEWTV